MNMIKFINLDRHWNDVGESIFNLANASLQFGQCVRGPIIQDVEGRIAKQSDRDHCVMFSNCSDALAQGLRNLQLPKGSEILVPEYTFRATINAIKLVGHIPVLCDVDDYYHIDLDDAKNKITSNTKALIYVTLLGNPARTDIDVWCNSNDIMLIEDAAQSFGTKTANSVFSVHSFSPTKPCTSFGSGGALVTNSAKVAQLARTGRVHGTDDCIGINSQISTFEASALLINLSHLEQHAQRRAAIAQHYITELSDKYSFPVYRKDCTYSKFVLQCDQRNKLKQHLQSHGIDTAIHYATQHMPKSKKLSAVSLTLSNCAYMTDQEVEKVTQCLKEF